MEKDDQGSTLIRIGVSGWKFLLVPAYPGCSGSKAVKRSLLLLLLYRLTQAVLEKRLLNGCVVAVLSKKNNDHQIPHDADDADHNNQHITWVLYAKLQSCLDDKEQQMQTVDDSYAACHKNLLTIFQAHHRMLK